MSLRYLVALCGVVYLAACEGSHPADSGWVEVPPPSESISDGAHGGNEDFYFLPPMVQAPETSGEFDAGALGDLAVEVCELTGASCGPVVVTFTSTTGSGASVLSLDAEAEHYGANWKTRDFDLIDGAVYRVRVTRAGLELGFADIEFVEAGKKMKDAETDDLIQLKEDGVLPIRFRLEIAEGVTIDATALTVPSFLIGGMGFFDGTIVQQLDLAPGNYTFAEQSGGGFLFTVNADGTLDYDATLDPFLSGRGTSQLVVQGFDITIDAIALSSHNFLIGGAGFFDRTVVHTTTHVPGSKQFGEQSGGSFLFTIGADGTIDYDASLDAFLSGRGTTGLVVHGFDISIDATALSAHSFLIGGAGVFDRTVVQGTTHVPGPKQFGEQSGGSFIFTLGADGTIDYDASLDAFLSGRGTTGLVVRGFDITIDATALSSHSFLLGGSGSFDRTVVHTTTHVPGSKQFGEQSGGSFLFTIGADGTIDYDASLDAFLSGRGTSGLVVQGFDITIDATGLGVSSFLLGGAGTFDANLVQSTTHVPGAKTFSSSVLTFQFMVVDDGTLDYDGSLDGQVAGRGTSSLVVSQ